MSRTTCRPSATVFSAEAVSGSFCFNCCGVIRVSLEATLRSSIGKSAIVLLVRVTGAVRQRSRCGGKGPGGAAGRRNLIAYRVASTMTLKSQAPVVSGLVVVFFGAAKLKRSHRKLICGGRAIL